MQHQYDDCGCNEAYCAICDGGLSFCKVCGLFEGALTTHCPGEKVSYEVSDQIYGGFLDYRVHYGGWVAKPNPCNQWSIYGKHMEKARGMGLDRSQINQYSDSLRKTLPVLRRCLELVRR